MPRHDDRDPVDELTDAVQELNATIQGRHGDVGLAGRLKIVEDEQKRQNEKRWSRSDLISLISFILAVISVVSAFFLKP